MGREVGRPCHAGPRRCSTDARCGSCAAASLSTRRSATRLRAARPGRAMLFVRFSPGGAPGVQDPSQACSHAPGSEMFPSAGPACRLARRRSPDRFHRADHGHHCHCRPRSDQREASASGTRPERDPAGDVLSLPILPWALFLHQGFGHDIMCISRHPSRESPAPAPGFPGRSAHGFTAPRWRRRAGLDHRLNPLARTISGRRRPFSVLRG